MIAAAAFPAAAQTRLALPVGSVETARIERSGLAELPIGPYDIDTRVTKPVEGRILTRSWKTPRTAGTPFDLLRSLREGLLTQEFEILFQCEGDGCGGFDFRFGIDVLSPPAMEVDLADFHFLSAMTGDEPPVHVTVLTSSDALNGFVQVREISPALAAPQTPEEQVLALDSGPSVPSALPPSDWSSALERFGHAVIDGLVFASGNSALADESAGVLADLASFLKAAPELRIHIVGHSDARGSLSANMALSKARAEAVRRALIQKHDVPAGRLSASGIGYLSPLLSNRTEEGRTRNRRVEIVVE